MRPPLRTALLLAAALALGAWMRLWFIWHLPQVNGDGLVYGDIARNWLLHGVYGRTLDTAAGPVIRPTLIRLPGYPLFLAICFRIFGVDHYGAVLYLQLAIDLLSALLVGWTSSVVAGARAGIAAVWLACLCPFTANFVACPLTETLSVFCVAASAAALAWLVRSPGWRPCVALALAWGYATLLRPDGALLAVAGFAAVVLFANRGLAGAPPLGRVRALRLALIAGALSVLPFCAWTARNLRTFHIFEPLAPRYATDPGEFTAPGFQRWMKTWALDFASTFEIYWNVDSDTLDLARLPARAFDSDAERLQTERLFEDYNRTTTLTPELDARFGTLAAARERAHPIRSLVVLPCLRVLDMWLRPRTEMLNIELRWWEYSRHHAETEFAAAWALLNLAYLLLGARGAWMERRRAPLLAGFALFYCVLRSLLLATIEAPEARYTVEAFPLFCLFAGTLAARPLKPRYLRTIE
jgi:hypothetical protein